MKRALSLRTIAKGAGTVVVAIVALDLIATAVAIAFGVQVLGR